MLKPDLNPHCLFPEICGPKNGYQCENWLRNLEGCAAVHTRKAARSMATDKRKSALRADVDAKMKAHGYDGTFRLELLWEIIDSLVDECATWEWAVGKKDKQILDLADECAGSTTMEYRCLWEERLAGEWYPFSGKVQTSELCLAEAERRGQSPEYRMVHIEARRKSNREWIPPCDVQGS